MGQPTFVSNRKGIEPSSLPARSVIENKANSTIGNFQSPKAQPSIMQNTKTLFKSATNRLTLGIDVPLLIVVIFLLIIGLEMVYSASWNYVLHNWKDATFILKRQLIWAAMGSTLAVVISFTDYHRLRRWILPIMAITLLMLLLVLFLYDDPQLPRRTMFKGSIQPSELAKMVIIIYLSVWLFSKREHLNDFSFGLLPLLTILGFTAGLVMAEPDISAAASVILLGGILFFIAGGQLRQILVVVITASLFGLLVVKVSITAQDRVNEWLLGLQDPLKASYHVQRSMEAIIQGKVLGVGLGKSSTKFTGLPVPWTDSIFAVIAEETGLLGGALVITLYLILLWRGLSIAQRAPDMLGRLLAGGLTLWISIEAFINIGVMVNLIPFAGNALPLISAGGSNMVTTLVAIGIIMSISRAAANPDSGAETPERRAFSAIVDLRRRDRRRSVPRNDRPRRTQ